MKLNLAYSCNAYMRCSAAEAVSRIAALGFSGVEMMADVPHLWPADATAADIEAVRGALDTHGLSISNLNAFMMNKIGDARQPYWHPSWIEPDEAYSAVRIQHTRDALTMARQLRAPSVTTEPGGPIESDAGYAAAMTRFVENLKPVVEHAERQGVPLLVEPEPGLLIERFDQYLELRARIDSPFLGLNFDIGHAYCVGEDPAEWIPKMVSHTRHYHIEDIAASREHRHLVPGTGAIDSEAVLRALDVTGYDGWVTVELYPFVDDPDAAGSAAKRHLEALAAAL